MGEVTQAQMDGIQDVISQRLVLNNITDYEIYTDVTNKQVIVRFPWKNDEQDFDPQAAIDELGKTAQLEFRKGTETEEVEEQVENPETGEMETKKVTRPKGELVLTGEDVDSATAMFDNSNNKSEPVVSLKLKASGTEKFSAATEELVASKGSISIWLDNEQLSAPMDKPSFRAVSPTFQRPRRWPT